jgi:hypothetical protein
MKNWIRALLSETLFSIWWFLSGLSTLATFLLPSLSGKPRIALAISTITGFAWANYRVFQKQEGVTASLKAALATTEKRTSELRIRPDQGSRYIARPVNNILKADFNGLYVEFSLMIENSGRRNSTVTGYQVEIVELRQTFQNLQPLLEGESRAQGRHCQHGLQPTRILSKTRIIGINAESATGHGSLLFLLPGVTFEQFATAGLGMSGEERRLPDIQCRLTITDTTNSSANAEFQLHED